ncbi:hypothetical protein [Streptomyces sp. R17]|uniref:Uncharacterized protein n=1 Tax=Streptomyces sp. R17 TaxID=3238626 RepID=A0AB39NXG0_9ACTN
MAVTANTLSIESIAGRIHTPESFVRAIIASVLQNAVKEGRSADDKGNVAVPGNFTVKKITQTFRSDPMTVELCWEDEGAQMSVCIYV